MEKQIQFILTSPEELTNQISDVIKIQFEEFKKEFEPKESKESKEYISRNDVAEKFSCHISTVDNLCDKGILTKYQVSGMVRLRAEEVENAIVKLK